MSCNIDRWKLKKVSDLKITISDLYVGNYGIQQPVITDVENMKCKIAFDSFGSGSVYIEGYIEKDKLFVTNIHLEDENSGLIYREILIPALKKSTGILEVVTYWETNEVFRLKVENGDIEDKEIDL